jgi:hypothetical protein
MAVDSRPKFEALNGSILGILETLGAAIVFESSLCAREIRPFKVKGER